jgi:hypothetical protein
MDAMASSVPRRASLRGDVDGSGVDVVAMKVVNVSPTVHVHVLFLDTPFDIPEQ